MELSLPPPPPMDMYARMDSRSSLCKGWERVAVRGEAMPCQRSLHAGAVWRDCFVVFGGYDGHHRVNDLYAFDFKTSEWKQLDSDNAPTPRDRHVAAVYDNSLYIFGGFDGTTRVNDLHAFDFDTNTWNAVEILGGTPPSPRHSHAAVVYQDSMFVFGGYDGSYRSDLHEFNFSTRRWYQVQCNGEIPRARYRGTCVVSETSMILHGGHDGNRHLQDTHVFDFCSLTWSALVTEGPIPSPRDSHVSVIYGKSMFLYGGSTGSAMGDFHELRLEFRRVWAPVATSCSEPDGLFNNNHGVTSLTRQVSFGLSNASAVGMGSSAGSGSATSTPNHTRSVTGFPATLTRTAPAVTPTRAGSGAGSGGLGVLSGSMSSLLISPSGIGIDANTTAAAGASGGVSCGSGVKEDMSMSPGVRFCHVGVVYDSALYIFGGYDGAQRLNDFLRFRFDQAEPDFGSPPSSLITDLRGYVNNEVLSDVQFIVEGIPVHAHKILCLRCPFFRNLLTGEYMESRAREVTINDVSYGTFLLLLQYVYCDQVDIAVETAMDLFQAADRFGLERLKRLCEMEMLSAISIESAANILFTADQHNAENLRERCIAFILHHFDEISRTRGFEEMGRTNVELVFEILRRR